VSTSFFLEFQVLIKTTYLAQGAELQGPEGTA
jgi:hypothetical protein